MNLFNVILSPDRHTIYMVNAMKSRTPKVFDKMTHAKCVHSDQTASASEGAV